MRYSKNIPTLALLTSLMGVSSVLAMNTESESDNDGHRSTVQVKQSQPPKDLDEEIEQLKKQLEIAVLKENIEDARRKAAEHTQARLKNTEEEEKKASTILITAKARRDALTREEYERLSQDERKALVLDAAKEEGIVVYIGNKRVFGPSVERLLKRQEKKLGLRTH